MHRRLVQDDLSDVSRAVAWADQALCEAGLPEDVRFNAQVCLEEALANLIMHGRAQSEGKDLTVEIAKHDRGVRIVVFDRCVPFDVAGAAVPARPQPDDIGIGGQGLRLLHAFTSELDYRTIEGRNALTMIFHAPSSTTQ